ncbi:MAG: hypothetical protein K2L95_02565 [Alphaproteobacteria bacterium]|nr:hypothetical protein [Alphaproteobacteria bacterium]
MARILQIRRGTTAQNNNFTGLPGEVSFDTDAKTLRVHDGETLGGFPLARADQTTSAPGGASLFDITTVPDEFWQNIISKFTPNPFQIHTSRTVSVVNMGYMEYVWNESPQPKFAYVALVCQTPEADYSVGDTVMAFGIGDRTNPLPNVFSDSLGLHVRLAVGSENFWVSHKTTGVKTPITNDRWGVKFIIWY